MMAIHYKIPDVVMLKETPRVPVMNQRRGLYDSPIKFVPVNENFVDYDPAGGIKTNTVERKATGDYNHETGKEIRAA